MHEDFEQVRAEYVKALRPVVMDVLAWWNSHCPYPHTTRLPPDQRHPFHRRWIAGPASHPRIIDVFRTYYFRVQELNERLSGEHGRTQDEASGEELWGVEAEAEDTFTQRPIDLLVNDLASVAPDLYEVMQGFVYVPVGMDPEGEEC